MKSCEVRFVPLGKTIEESFVLKQESDDSYVLESNSKIRLPLRYKEGRFIFESIEKIVEEDDAVVADRLLGLSQDWLEFQQQDLESEGVVEEQEPFSLDQLYVEQKNFTIAMLLSMIDDGDIELDPDFQRYFIWDYSRQSKLIESALIGYPLPALYLSQYDDGRMTVVDGLQRLNTIKRFMHDELVLSNLGVLREYEGMTYSQIKSSLSPLRLRRFMQTQIPCFILDYRSPLHVKYDLFRRLNTGGKPLTNAEIRNCMSRPLVREAISNMLRLPSYIRATGNSIRGSRMEDRDLVLRFMYFFDRYSDANPLGDYNGYIEQTLDAYTEELNRKKDFADYVANFDKGMFLADKMFGLHSFRKYRADRYYSRRPPINKLLYVVIVVLLAKYGDSYSQSRLDAEDWKDLLAQRITASDQLFWALSGSTSSKQNMWIVYASIRELFNEILL